MCVGVGGGGGLHPRSSKNKTYVNKNAGVCMCVCVRMSCMQRNYVHSVLRKYFHDTKKSGLFLTRKRKRDFIVHSNWLTPFGKIMAILSENHIDMSVHFVGKMVELLKLEQVTTSALCIQMFSLLVIM